MVEVETASAMRHWWPKGRGVKPERETKAMKAKEAWKEMLTCSQQTEGWEPVTEKEPKAGKEREKEGGRKSSPRSARAHIFLEDTFCTRTAQRCPGTLPEHN